MRFKIPMLCLALWMAVGLSGCASVMTFFGPLKSKLVDGDRTPGELSRYKYDLRVDANRVVVRKTPLCKEMVEKLRVAKKQRRGVYMALIEMPFFGYGLLDWVETAAISEESIRVQPLATYESGRLIECGSLQPAAGEVLVVEDKELGSYYRGTTNSKGVLFLNRVLKDVKGPVVLNIRPAADSSVSLTYIYQPGQGH